MRKILAMTMAVLLVVSLAACGDTSATDSSLTSAVATESTTTTGSRATTASRDVKTTTTTSATTASVVVPNEKPITYNTAILFDGQHSSYDNKAESKRQSILGAKDTVKASGTTYYVSYNGSDANDGLTPATAWRSTQRVGAAVIMMEKNCTVLFERGGVYRGTMLLRDGMTVGAYGSGSKPQLYASLQNYADESLWKETSTANVWRIKLEGLSDVGNIIFDHGKACASAGKRLNLKAVTEDMSYYHDTNKGYLYLYMSKGNPGKLYSSIEIATNKHALGAYTPDATLENVTIENLCIKYTGAHGISFGSAKNVKITNCEIGYIGGSMQNGKKVRYGNGIEFYGDVEGALIENNWIYQCYDAGYTNQGAGNVQNNITVKGNLIEYCNYNIEVFISEKEGGKVTNTSYESNILRFAGYGFGSYNRIGSDCSQTANIRNSLSTQPCQNFVIKNNVFDCSAYRLVNSGYVDGKNGPLFSGNTWIQNDNTKTACAVKYCKDGKVASDQPAGDLATMKASVALVDKTATVIFE